jgi:hypothetical protein
MAAVQPGPWLEQQQQQQEYGHTEFQNKQAKHQLDAIRCSKDILHWDFKTVTTTS